MYCGKCGSQMPDGASFCGVCGNKVEPQQRGGVAVPVNNRSKKKIVIICAAVLAFALLLFVFFKFVFVGPGDKIFDALEKTIEADSLEGVLKVGDADGYWDVLECMAMGKDEDFKIFGSYEDRYFLYEDETFTYCGREEYTEELSDFMAGIATRDPIKVVESNKNIKRDIQKYFVENYEEIIPVARKLLNDTDADYIESYEKSGDTYKYKIDIIKLYEAAEDKGLEFGNRFDDDFVDECDYVTLDMEITLDGGYIDEAEGSFKIKDGRYTEEVKVELDIKSVNEIDEDDFDDIDFSEYRDVRDYDDDNYYHDDDDDDYYDDDDLRQDIEGSQAEESSVAEIEEESEEEVSYDDDTPVDISKMPSYLQNQDTASFTFSTDMNVDDICTPLGEYGGADESHVNLSIEELEGVPMLRCQVLDKDKEGKYLIPKLQFHMENLFKGKESELPKIFTIKADVIAKAVGTYHSEETGDDMMVPGWAGGRMVSQPYDGSTNTWNELVDWEIQEWTSEWAYSEFMCRPGIKDAAKFSNTKQPQFLTLLRWGIPNQQDFYIANLTFLDEDGNVLECSYGK